MHTGTFQTALDMGSGRGSGAGRPPRRFTDPGEEVEEQQEKLDKDIHSLMVDVKKKIKRGDEVLHPSDKHSHEPLEEGGSESGLTSDLDDINVMGQTGQRGEKGQSPPKRAPKLAIGGRSTWTLCDRTDMSGTVGPLLTITSVT